MARYFGVPLRNGLPIGLGSVMAMGNPRGAPAPIPDPYFEYTTLLLPGNGTNGAQNNTFLDSSTNAFSITRNGNTTQGTFSPFSQTGWSNYFDGSGDYCTLSSNASMDFGAGNFTIECWVYTGVFSISAGASRTIIGNSGNSYTMQLYIETGSGKVVFGNTGSTNLQGTNTVADNQWHHIVVVRSGTGSNQTALFVDGNRQAVGTNSQNYSSGTIYLGAFDTGNGFWNGYISNLRIVKGTAVYDPTVTTLTVPTTPLTAVSNTALLTFQSNRFIDNSSNAYTITRNGDVSVQAFSPFNPTAAWSAATNGGSGYFDGSGDSLTFTDSSNALDLGGATASFECWIYAPNVSSGQGIFNKSGNTDSWNTSNGYEYNVYITGGTINFYYNNAGTGATGVSGSIVANQWTHVAVATNSSNAISLYINGTRVSTATNAITKPTTRTSMRIGNTVANEFFSGYISGLRFISGSGAYDASQTTITIPTAPPTAITNTSLLCNFTNAGIYDATSKNDLETVGNAQISTTQSKFGGSSVYIDGTGDYLLPNSPASNNILALGSGDFTIEFWARFSALGDRIILDGRPSSTQGAYPTILTAVTTNKLQYYANSAIQITSTNALSIDTWYHIAIVRYSGSTKMYINGVNEGSTYADSTNYLTSSNRPVIGASGYTEGSFASNFYINDLRITKGIARYTNNFTPPTTAFPLL